MKNKPGQVITPGRNSEIHTSRTSEALRNKNMKGKQYKKQKHQKTNIKWGTPEEQEQMITQQLKRHALQKRMNTLDRGIIQDQQDITSLQ